MTKYNYFNNTGGLNLHSSLTALDESEKSTEWHDAQNVESLKSGALVKMKGCLKINKTELLSDVTILGMHDYKKASAHHLIINTSEGKLYRLSNNSFELIELYNGLDTTAKCSYINYNNGVIISNGVDVPLFYEDGNESAKPLDESTPKGVTMEVYKARLFIAKDSCLYFSSLGNPNEWNATDAGFIENFHNDSSPIVAIKNYGEYLAIYKQNTAYVLSGSSPNEFSISAIADKGATSRFSVCTVENNQYFFNGENITPLRFNELGQILLSDDVSKKISPIFNDLDNSRYDEIICLPYVKKSQIWFFFPERNGQDLSVCYIYDYFHKCWYKRRGIPAVSACLMDGDIYTGTSDGRILKEDITDSFDGEKIEAYWLSPNFTFGSPISEKEIISCNVWVLENLQYPLKVNYIKDYTKYRRVSEDIEVFSSDFMLWSQALDTSQNAWDELVWSGCSPVCKSINVNGTFRTFQIGVENMEANQAFTLIGYSFEVDKA